MSSQQAVQLSLLFCSTFLLGFDSCLHLQHKYSVIQTRHKYKQLGAACIWRCSDLALSSCCRRRSSKIRGDISPRVNRKPFVLLVSTTLAWSCRFSSASLAIFDSCSTLQGRARGVRRSKSAARSAASYQGAFAASRAPAAEGAPRAAPGTGTRNHVRVTHGSERELTDAAPLPSVIRLS